MLIKTLATVTAIAATALALLASAPGFAQNIMCNTAMGQTFCYGPNGQQVVITQVPRANPYYQPINPMAALGYGNPAADVAQIEIQQKQAALLRLQVEEARRRCRASGSWNCN